MSEEKELPRGWTSGKLEDFCTIIMGQSPPSSEYNENGEGLPFFQGKAEFTDLFPKVRKWCTAPTKIAEAEDILLSVRAPVGPTNLAPSLCCVGRGLAAIRPAKNIQVRYVLYAIRAYNSSLTELGTGTTFAAISGDDVRAFEIPLAPSPEQIRIVSAIEQQFSRLDAGVAALQRAKAKLKRYRAVVLRAAVEGKLTETWRAEHPTTEPSSLARKRILSLVGEKSSNVNDKRRLWGAGHVTGMLDEASSTLPTTWELCKVRNLGHDSDNVVQIGPMSMKSSEFIPEGVPVLNVGCVKWGYFDLSKLDFLPLELATKFNRYRVKAGDVIFTRSGTVGRCAIIDKDKDNWLMTFHLLRVRVDVRICLPEYLMYVFEGFPPVRAQITSASIGSTRAGFNTRLLEELDIPLPPLQEQEQIIAEIAQRLSIITALENTIEANLKRAERLRQSILHEAFAGRLVPQDPTDELASVLLERIRDERNGQKHGVETSIKKNHSVKLPESATINVVDAEQTELWESVGN